MSRTHKKRKPINRVAAQRIAATGSTNSQQRKSIRDIERKEIANIGKGEAVQKAYASQNVGFFSTTNPKWECLYDHDAAQLADNKFVKLYAPNYEGKGTGASIGYAQGLVVSKSVKSKQDAGRTLLAPDMSEEALKSKLLEIATQDKYMSEFELQKASSVAPFYRPEFHEWCPKAVQWYKEVKAGYNPVIMKAAMRSLEFRLRDVAIAVRNAAVDAGHDTFVDENYNLIPEDLERGYDLTTKGRHFGYPFFTSAWDGSKKKNAMINDYMVDSAKSLIESGEYFDGLEPISILFSRVARGKVRPIVCPSKVNALLGRMIFEPLIQLFKSSNQFCGYLGGENIHEIVADIIGEYDYWAELDLEGHDENAKALVPLAVEILASLYDESVADILASWLRYNARMGIMTAYGISYPTNQHQLFGIISGDTFTSVLGGLVAALAMEYGIIHTRMEATIGANHPVFGFKHDDFLVPIQFYTYENHLNQIITGDKGDPMECEFAFPLLCDRLNKSSKWTDMSLDDLVSEEFVGFHEPFYSSPEQVAITYEAFEQYPLFTFGDDGLMASDSREDIVKIMNATIPTGVVINQEKTYICKNSYANVEPVENYQKVVARTNERTSFLGWHYFSEDVYAFACGSEMKARFSVMRSIAPKLIYLEYGTQLKDIRVIIDAVTSDLTTGDYTIPVELIQENLATVMKLDLARNNDCFRALTSFAREVSPLKLNTTLIYPYEQVLTTEAVREMVRISRDRLSGGFGEFPVIKLLHELEHEDGIITSIPKLFSEYGEPINKHEHGSRSKITLFSVKDKKQNSNSQGATNKPGSKQTSKAQKVINQVEAFMNDCAELSARWNDARSVTNVTEKVKLTAELNVHTTMMFGKNGDAGRKKMVMMMINAKIDSGNSAFEPLLNAVGGMTAEKVVAGSLAA